MLRSRATIAAVSLLAVLAAITLFSQPVPSPQRDAPLLSGVAMPPEVIGILRRSCADCHSEATTYPWYSYVAPVSLLIQSDVNSGRRHLNFTTWNEYPAVRRMRLLSEIANQVRDREMPIGIYTLMHRNARLSDTEINAIFDWTQAERARMIAGGTQ